MSCPRPIATFAALIILLASWTFPSLGQDDASSEAGDNAALGGKETVLRVLQLSQELERLLASLPAERQEELRGMLIDRLTAPGLQEQEQAAAKAIEPDTEAPQALAAQQAPELETGIRPAASEAEPIAREPASLEPIDTTGTLEPTVIASNSAETREPRTTPSPSLPPLVPSPERSPGATPRRGGCQTLLPFDSNGDGKITGLDRFWRHFYLWSDVNENRSVDERELEAPYERGIREIDVGLRSFVRGKGKRKRALDIQLEQYILLDIGGDGWSGTQPRGDDGALAVDVSAIRKAGGPDMHDGRGRALEGVQPFKPGWILRLEGGEQLVANCPKS